MRNIWKGAISFGLVHVPVKLYPATEKKDIKFNYLHEKCKTPLKYQRVCPNCDTEVSTEEIVKGYEYEKGKYVVIKEEDFENIPSEGTKSVDIVDFVDLQEIDPIYFDKTYYLAPNEGGQKAYELLKKSMEDTNKIAVAKVVLRNKQSLAVLRVSKGIILMETMFFPDEIRPVAAVPEIHYQVKLHENEIKMAESLISNLSAPFEPSKYTDEYRQAMMDIIQAKIIGKEVEIPTKPEVGKVVDLMEALKASIALAKEEKKAKNPKAKTRAKASKGA